MQRMLNLGNFQDSWNLNLFEKNISISGGFCKFLPLKNTAVKEKKFFFPLSITDGSYLARHFTWLLTQEDGFVEMSSTPGLRSCLSCL